MNTAVLYLTNTRHGQLAWKNPSARHRCYHYADAISAGGWGSSVMHIDEMRPEFAKSFQHIVFHRPVNDHRFLRAIEKCKDGDAVLHADYDDLLFEPELASVSPRYLNGNSTVESVAREFSNNLQALKVFDSFIVSTRFLASRIRLIKPGAAIYVLANSMPRQFVVPDKIPQSHKYFTIGYFPGSASHGHDFKSIKEALAVVLENHRHCRLLIAGQFRKEDCDELPRVKLLPFVDYNRYLYLLRQVDLSIAPLVDNYFNQAKSAVKLIESVSVGTKIVASPNDDMRDHSNKLVEFCCNTQDWLENLNNLVNANNTCSGRTEPIDDRFTVGQRLPGLLEHFQCAA